jgi:hypothetical protein
MPSALSRQDLAKAKLAALEKLLGTNILESVKCKVCGCTDTSVIIMSDDEWICENCGTYCDGCGVFYMRDALLPIETFDRGYGEKRKSMYCQNCMVECAICKKVVAKSITSNIYLSMYDGARKYTCKQCLNKLIQCGDCGAYEYRQKLSRCKKCNCSWCSRCKGHSDEHRCTPAPDLYLSQYNYKPPTIFLPTYRREDMYLGVELEFIVNKQTHYECCDELTRLAKQLGDFFYLKRDGSLGDWGVELVTQPATLDYHIKTNCWRLILNTILKNGGSTNSSCGLHVHVSKNYVSGNTETSRYWESGRQINDTDDTFKLNLWKLSAIFNKHWSDLFTLSRRVTDRDWIQRYCKRPPKVSPDMYYELMQSYYDYGKYTAVNITNSHTIEYRLWAGTVKENEMLATIELCAALTRYAKENSIMTVLAMTDIKALLNTATTKWGMKRLGSYLDNFKQYRRK